MSFLVQVLTSMNHYSFLVIFFLFISSLFISEKKMGMIVPFRILFGILLFGFMVIGWSSFGHHKEIPNKGKKITFTKKKMEQLCNLRKVKKYVSGYVSIPIAYNYKCEIYEEETFIYSRNYAKIKTIGALEAISPTKEFTIIDYVYMENHGMLITSFAGSGKVSSYILVDKNNITYDVYHSYVEEEIKNEH